MVLLVVFNRLEFGSCEEFIVEEFNFNPPVTFFFQIGLPIADVSYLFFLLDVLRFVVDGMLAKTVVFPVV